MVARALVGDRILANRVVRARGFWGRIRGLIGRVALQDGEGMLLVPCNSVHTAFMGYPIDVVFLDAEDRVTALRRELKPWRMAQGGLAARKTLELAAGGAGQVRVGDQVRWDWTEGTECGGGAR